MFKRVVVIGSLLVIALSIVVTPVWAKGPIEGRAGRAEVRFMEAMIDHHQMALEMANDCLKKASTDSVKTLCQAIIKVQTPEIVTMQGWLKEWYTIDYKPQAMADMGMGGMGNMPGMAATDPAGMMGMMAGLNRLVGKDYEIAWLESMIDHHSDAMTMSNRILSYPTIHDELKALATSIIKAQSAEIIEMEAMLKKLGSK